MKSAVSTRRADGFTLVEMLVVIAIIGILAALLLPALTGGKARAKRIVCETQLQQVGIGFQSFAHDHNSRFPMQVRASDGGAQEWVTVSQTNGSFAMEYEFFEPLAGTLDNPRILVCPADTRSPASSFAALQNSNVSYFVGVSATYNEPMAILAGDGNLAASATMVHGAAGGRLTWNSQVHKYQGNVLFADGHVEEWRDGGPNLLADRSDLALPNGNGGGGQSGGTGTATAPGGSASAGGTEAATAPVSASGRASPTNLSASPGSLLAGSQRGSAPHQPGGYSATTATTGADGGQAEVSDSDAKPVPPPAAAGAGAARAQGDDSMMSPFDRKVAHYLRMLIFGTYLLILLLLLAYVSYRVWRWAGERERKRGRRRD